MVLEIGGELVVYVVACALGVSIGITSGITLPRRLGVIMMLASLVIVGGVVSTGFMLGSEAPWVGPIFVFAALGMRVVTGAMELARIPALRREPFAHRAVLVFSPQRVRIIANESTIQPGAESCSCPTR